MGRKIRFENKTSRQKHTVKRRPRLGNYTVQYSTERMCEEVKGHQERMVKANGHLIESQKDDTENG